MHKLRILITLLVLFALCLSSAALAATYTLRANGSGDFPNIQAALDAAGDGDKIQLESGVYTGPGNRDIRFLGKEVTLVSETDEPGICIIDCDGSVSTPRRGFLFDSGEGALAVLRGVTIRGGSTSGAWPENAGGGIYCRNQSSPRIENCIIRGNRSGNGAGICCDGSSSPDLIACVIEGNSANFYGGGIYCYDNSSPFIQDCHIDNNRAGYYGGGLRSANSAPEIIGSTFSCNQATYGGAGLAFSGDASASISNCTIAKNRTPGDGGGLYCYYSSPSLENTLIADNEAEGVFIYGSSIPHFQYCNIHGNERGDWLGSISSQLGESGNLSDDPQFCTNQDDGCFLIQSDSPCAGGNETGEGIIGAWEIGCQDFNTEDVTWSKLKSLH